MIYVASTREQEYSMFEFVHEPRVKDSEIKYTPVLKMTSL